MDRARSGLRVVGAILALSLAARAAGASAEAERHRAALAPAESLAAHGQFERASAYADSIQRDAHSRGDNGLEAYTASRRALRWVSMGRFDDGVSEARRVAALARAERDTVSWCYALLAEGRAQLFRERLAEAAPPYRRLLPLAVAVRDPMLEGNARLGLAYLDLSAGRAAAAEAGYRRAIVLLERARDTYSEMAARVGLARTQRRRGDNAEAKRSYERIVERCHATGDRANEADAWNNLGALAAAEGDPARAAECVARARDLARSTGRSGAQELRNLAILLVEAGRAGAAEESLTAGLARLPRAAWREAYPLRTQLALVRGLMGRRAEAERMLREQWAARDSVAPDAAADAGFHLVAVISAGERISEAYTLALELERWTASRLGPETEVFRRLQLASLERRMGRPADALVRLRALQSSQARGSVASWRDRLQADVELSKVFEALGHPDSAVAAARRAAGTWERTASALRDAEWYEPVGNSGSQAAVQLVQVLLDPRRPGGPASRAREAFDQVQRFKSRALDWRARPGSARPALVTAAELQRSVLRADEVFVDAYSSQSDSSFVFVLDRSGVGVHHAPALDALESDLSRPLAVLLSTEPDAADFRPAAARRLAALLFGDELPRVRRARRVFTSLSGLVNAIPVAALPADTLARVPLAEGRTIVSVPSATWLAHARRAAPAALDPARVVVLARASDDRGQPLAGVREEAAWLAGRYRAAGVTHAGERDLAEVLPWLARGDILHVASHARTSMQDPWGSAMLLGRGSGEDAWLSARGVASLHPSARLAVLASCRSTLDRGFGNESVLGLARAFLAAGVPTVVSTLWPVDDRVTTDFTRRFYLALEGGAGAAEALRRAQAETRRVPATSAPFYWAGFIVSGDPDTRVRPRRAP